eukprot:sb/3478951/
MSHDTLMSICRSIRLMSAHEKLKQRWDETYVDGTRPPCRRTSLPFGSSAGRADKFLIYLSKYDTQYSNFQESQVKSFETHFNIKSPPCVDFLDIESS